MNKMYAEISVSTVKDGTSTYKLESYIIQVNYQLIWVWRKCTVDIDKLLSKQTTVSKIPDCHRLNSYGVDNYVPTSVS